MVKVDVSSSLLVLMLQDVGRSLFNIFKIQGVFDIDASWNLFQLVYGQVKSPYDQSSLG